MTHNDIAGAAPTGPAPVARQAARDIDDQIAATWRALHVNPDLDARCALAAIDELLDRRAGAGAGAGAGRSPEPGGPLAPGSTAQRAILGSILYLL